MKHYIDDCNMLKAYSQNQNETSRIINPMDLNLPPGYSIEVSAFGLDTPSGMAFSENGDLYIAESGVKSRNPKILRLANGHFDIMAENFSIPITGISYFDERIYISHGGNITVLRADGTRQNIISGLPCNGDYGISNIALGADGKLYFGLGSATNSGVVGIDNEWVISHPLLHDEPAFDIMLNGQNYATNNMLIAGREIAYTGAFSAYGTPNIPYEIIKGVVKASGSILSVNRDGTELRLVAGGLRNPIYVKFDRESQLFISNRGYDVRGSRPIANAPDEFHILTPGAWYGWPDFSAGKPLTMPRFKPEGGLQPEFLLTNHPGIPPIPYAEFPSHSSIRGFAFNYNNNFGPYGDIYIAEYGSYGPITMGQSAPHHGIGHRISKIDINTREVSTFISNKSGLPGYFTGEGGLGRPLDIEFGPDGAMYILDTGNSDPNNLNQLIPNTGVLWRIIKKS